MIRNSNDETNFPHKLLLTNTQVSTNRKAIANGSHQLIKIFQDLNCIKLDNQEDFQVEF